MRFERGTGPLVSVLLPTRLRAACAVDTVNSVLSNCSNPDNVEVLVRDDDDDPQHRQLIDGMAALPHAHKIRIFTGPRREGYFSLHEFYNELCVQATGDWVMMFNDDAKIVTKGWDEVLEKFEPPKKSPVNSVVAMGHFEMVQKDQDFVFPMVRRQSVKILGHLSLHPHNDAWLIYVYRRHRAVNWDFVVPGVTVDHFNNSIHDQTRAETANAQHTSMKNFGEYIPLIDKDQKILKTYL